MKIRVTLKDPDGFFDAVSEAVEASVATAGELTDDEAEALSEARRERIEATLEPWVEYNEYVDLEFDTEAGTARVLRRDGKDEGSPPRPRETEAREIEWLLMGGGVA